MIGAPRPNQQVLLTRGSAGSSSPSSELPPSRPTSREAGGRPYQLDRDQLLALSDARDLCDLAGARTRIGAIAAIFADRTDLRGVFPLIYRIGLDDIVACLEKGRFTDPDWVHTFDVAFAARYLDNLHRHLRDGKTTRPWAELYRRLDTDSATVTAIAATALNAHLLSDLPEALHASGVRARHRLDYQAVSRLIWATAPAAITAVETVYGTDLLPIYQAAPLNWPLTALTGRTAATQEQLFNAVSGVAFSQGVAMANPLTRPLIRAQISGRMANRGCRDRSPNLNRLTSPDARVPVHTL